MIEIEEPPESYTPPERDGLVLIYCDCSISDPCPQGPKVGAAPLCQIWIRKDQVSADKYKTKFR